MRPVSVGEWRGCDAVGVKPRLPDSVSHKHFSGCLEAAPASKGNPPRHSSSATRLRYASGGSARCRPYPSRSHPCRRLYGGVLWSVELAICIRCISLQEWLNPISQFGGQIDRFSYSHDSSVIVW